MTELHPTERLYRKIIKPSLGILNIDSHTSRHRIQLHSSYQPARMQGQLYTLKNRPRTEPTGSLVQTFPRLTDALVGSPEFSSNFVYSYNSQVQDDYANLQRSTTPQSFNSTSRVKQIPLPSVSPAGKSVSIGSGSPSRPLKSVSICSDRYITSQSKQSARTHRSEISSRCRSEQQRRFDTEEKSKGKSKALKRASEIIPHRIDRMYYMSGATLPMKSKYHVDNEELDRLKELARSRNSRGSRLRIKSSKGDDYIADRHVGIESQLAITNTDVATDGDESMLQSASMGATGGEAERRPATGTSWTSDVSDGGVGGARVRFKAAGPSSAKAAMPGNIQDNKDEMVNGNNSNEDDDKDDDDDSGVEPEPEDESTVTHDQEDGSEMQEGAVNSEMVTEDKKDDVFMTEYQDKVEEEAQTTEDGNNENTDR